jgi:hypothetical protein
MTRSAATQLEGERFVLLPRLQWLAPVRLPLAAAAGRAS